MFGASKNNAKASEGAENPDSAAPEEGAEVQPVIDPAIEQPKSEDEPKAEEENHSDMPSVDAWASDIAIPFLDLMDIANVNERRKELLSLEMGKKEENITALLNIADSYLFLVQKYYENTAPNDESAVAAVKVYIAKSVAMKAWLGI